jgi:tRNA threonylcarbamoyladenosine biosynthesis protein TsaE
MPKITSHSEQETAKLGNRLAKFLKPGDIVCLFGDLGSGKTTLVKGLVGGLKIKPSKVNSPTFVLMNIYEGKIPIYHFDLYRIEGKDLLNIGYEEFFYDEGIAVVEWAERLGAELPKEYIAVRLGHKNEKERVIEVSAQGKGLSRRLKNFKL